MKAINLLSFIIGAFLLGCVHAATREVADVSAFEILVANIASDKVETVSDAVTVKMLEMALAILPTSRFMVAEKSINTISSLLDSSNRAVIEDAANTLGLLGPPAKATVSHLMATSHRLEAEDAGPADGQIHFNLQPSFRIRQSISKAVVSITTEDVKR